MKDDDDPYTYGGREQRGSRPFGSGRRPRSGRDGGLFDLGMLERAVRELTSLFDDDDRGTRRGGGEGTAGWRTPGSQAGPGARPHDHAEEDVGAGRGEVSGQRSRTGGEGSGAGRDDGYADEEGAAAGSMRGRGPKGYKRTDKRLKELVNDALYDEDQVDASGIEVSVDDGDVTLAGTVPTRRGKHRAENVASRIAGVHDVDNRLRVRRGASATSGRAGGQDTGGSAGGTPGRSGGGTPSDAERDADDYGHP